jgi:hypothetical protein
MFDVRQYHGMGFLSADTQAPVRPSPTAPADVNLWSSILYVRSYLLMRAIIGFIGITLPIVLVVGDHLLGPNAPFLRSALSDYYFSGTRDAFVGGMFSIGVFLVTYKIFERTISNVLTLISGLAALAVGLFPTSRPDGVNVSLTPLQLRLGEETVSRVHIISSGIFIVSLAIMSFIFGLQEGRRPQQRPTGRAMLPPRFWRWFHWTIALVILVAVTVTTWATDHHTFARARLIGEVVAVVAFGASWLAKGLELSVLLGGRSRWRAQAAQTP